MPLTGGCWRADLSVCVCVCTKLMNYTDGNVICVCVCVPMSLLSHPVSLSRSPAWCHDSKPNWQAESHLAFATHTYSNIHPRAALSVLRVASAVLCYKDEALWRLERPSEDESKKKKKVIFFIFSDLLTGCCSLHLTAPSKRRTHTRVCSRFPRSVAEVLFGKTCFLKRLIPWLLVWSRTLRAAESISAPPNSTADELRLLCDILIYWLKMHVRRVSRGVLLPGKIKSLYLTDMLRIQVSVNEQALRHQRCRVDFQKRQKKKKITSGGKKKSIWSIKVLWVQTGWHSWATYFLYLERQFPPPIQQP